MGVNGGTAVNLTGSGSDPCNADSSDICTDPDAGGPNILGGQGDFRVVFAGQYFVQGFPKIEIWMGKVDVSEGTLVDAVRVAEEVPNGTNEFLHPAWCGSNHVVWDGSEPQTFGIRQICIREVNSSGPVGSMQCYFTDEVTDEQPACRYDGQQIAWARILTYGGVQEHDIMVMECDGVYCDTTTLVNLTAGHPGDDIHPVWSPSGSMIAFASDREQNEDDMDIWTMNANGEAKENRTQDYDLEDNEPDWGGATQ